MVKNMFNLELNVLKYKVPQKKKKKKFRILMPYQAVNKTIE